MGLPAAFVSKDSHQEELASSWLNTCFPALAGSVSAKGGTWGSPGESIVMRRHQRDAKGQCSKALEAPEAQPIALVRPLSYSLSS
jgi:hypothetical protein